MDNPVFGATIHKHSPRGGRLCQSRAMSKTNRTVIEVPGEGTVEVRRSARRRRTVSAFREKGRLVVAIPGRFTRAQEKEWVARMVTRVQNQEKKRAVSSEDLAKRAETLAHEYLPAGVRPSSVRWVTNQNSRWGSCTPLDGSIRISHRLKSVPSWVLDYVLVHELAHLVIPSHNDEFWAMVNAYPCTERARGFLDGMSFVETQGEDDGAEQEGEGSP